MNANELLQQARTAIQSGNRAGGEELIQQALQLEPENPTAHFYLGMSAMTFGDNLRAADCFQKAININPGAPEYYCNLGRVLWQCGAITNAANVLNHALMLKPQYPEALANLANVSVDLGKRAEAEEYVRASLKLRATPQGYSLLSTILKDAGRLDESRVALMSALHLEPRYEAAFVNLLHLNMHNLCDELAVANDFRQLGRAIASNTPVMPEANLKRDPDRKLRIGFISPDLFFHPVVFFLKPLLRAIDRSRFEIVCFSDAIKHDSETEACRKLADIWHDTIGVGPEAFAELVRNEQIDIAIDLAGLTRNNRLRSLARRPAPLQMTWLGFPHGTGSDRIDYRITDHTIDPDGSTQFYAEKLLYLPRAFFCFEPPVTAPLIGPPPRIRNGHYTFGSCNQLSKLPSSQLNLFARILNRVPGSRLAFKANVLNDDSIKSRLQGFFNSAGVSVDRLDFEGGSDFQTYLDWFNKVDLLLDSHPFNGHTNTLQGIYMGVPILTLAGVSAASRMGATILKQLQLEDLIAISPDDFVTKAVAIAGKPEQTDAARKVLRRHLLASPLCDASAFARDFGEVLRSAWKNMCQK